MNSGGACGGCPAALDGTNDGVLARFIIRVPTNVHSFSYDFRYFSADNHDYQCSALVDYFLTLLTSGAPGIPADKSISFDAFGDPVNVNSSFFQICTNQANQPFGSEFCPICLGAADLAGTGMDHLEVLGGGTPWLTTDAPVIPGEVITLEIMIFDTSDLIYDSLVLFDHFRWNVATASVSTHQ